MPHKITLVLSPKQAADANTYTSIAARKVGVSTNDVALARVIKRSIDARQRAIKVNLTLELYIDQEPQPEPIHFDYPDVSTATEVIVVGAGPAGLFAALRLIELGLRPIVVERGYDVSRRKRDVAQINRGGAINPNSNYAFGEGGAGTFSDGKLFTRSKKRGDYNKALQTLVFHGATPEILYEAHPHIGTDRLPRIMSNIRQRIEECGGEVHFGMCVDGLKVDGERVRGVYCSSSDSALAERVTIEAAAVVLATGHSAGDVYELLHKSNIAIEAKPFAMGVRIEHQQSVIDNIQYHCEERGELLPAASYSLVSRQGGRGVYSFCMCPGGFIVPAMTTDKECVVNGMSPSGRDSKFANSGIVTEIRTEDYAHLREEWGELAGLKFQRELEQLARQNGESGQVAPAQGVADFVAGRASRSLAPTSYIPGVRASRIDKWMPQFMAEALRGGIGAWGGYMRGFVSNSAVILGVESRTSSAVRIPRHADSLMNVSHAGLFPTGEGAGYAGGIISAALDGERVANAVSEYVK